MNVQHSALSYMPEDCGAEPNLPPELWAYIQRLAVTDISPLAKLYSDVDFVATTYEPLDARGLEPFLKTACSFRYVCRLWSQLAQTLLYENILVNDRHWPSLVSALNRPDIARLVRSVSLSNAQVDSKKFVLHHCPNIEVVIQPYPARSRSLYSALDILLPPLLSLRRLYWVDYFPSSSLLRAILAAAPHVEHITLVGELDMKSYPSPPLPFVQSFRLSLKTESVHSLLGCMDPLQLTNLVIDPASFFSNAFPIQTLPALRLLALVHPVADPHQLVYFPVIIARCPPRAALQRIQPARMARAGPDGGEAGLRAAELPWAGRAWDGISIGITQRSCGGSGSSHIPRTGARCFGWSRRVGRREFVQVGCAARERVSYRSRGEVRHDSLQTFTDSSLLPATKPRLNLS
ncbi:hypothetical protein B0H11DRAFT_2098395 [Mycena galericulata]|nr:hypothetical protein B0H11DRAFT_2098395 [Mycena galericulata]